MDSLAPEMDNNSNFALAVALEQAGVKSTGLFATGYQPDVITRRAGQPYRATTSTPCSVRGPLPNTATEQMQAAMEKYDGYSKSDFPSFASTKPGWG